MKGGRKGTKCGAIRHKKKKYIRHKGGKYKKIKKKYQKLKKKYKRIKRKYKKNCRKRKRDFEVKERPTKRIKLDIDKKKENDNKLQECKGLERFGSYVSLINHYMNVDVDDHISMCFVCMKKSNNNELRKCSHVNCKRSYHEGCRMKGTTYCKIHYCNNCTDFIEYYQKSKVCKYCFISYHNNCEKELISEYPEMEIEKFDGIAICKGCKEKIQMLQTKK